MVAKEIWNYLVSAHKEGKNLSESEIQSDWEIFFADSELFGYSRLKNEIIPHPKLVLGSTEREIPDILINKNNEKIFVAELKQYSISKNTKIEKQLLNYLTHTDIHLSIGILVCDKLYIYYYDFNSNSTISLEIVFIQDNPDGIKFVELFSKANYDQQAIIDFIKERNAKKNIEDNIRNELTVDLIKELLQKHFLELYPSIDFNQILKDYNIIISQNLLDSSLKFNSFVKTIDKTKKNYSLNNQTLAKRQIVLNVMKDYIRNNPNISFDELKEIFPDKLQGSLGVFQDDEELLCAKYKNNKKEYQTRFFTKPEDKIQLQSGRILVVCGEWGNNFENFYIHAKKLGYDIKQL